MSLKISYVYPQNFIESILQNLMISGNIIKRLNFWIFILYHIVLFIKFQLQFHIIMRIGAWLHTWKDLLFVTLYMCGCVSQVQHGHMCPCIAINSMYLFNGNPMHI